MQQNSIETRQLEALLDFYLEAGVDSFPGDDRVDWFELTRQQAALRQQGQEPRPAAQAPSGPAADSTDARDTRHSQFAPPAKTIPAQPTAPSSGQPAVIPDREIVGAARDLAATAATLDDLRSCLEAFDGCNLKLTAKKLVFADGNPDARLMFVGEAPGRDEDFQGKPFVGRSGQLLDSMLTAIGLDRSSAYIANVVPWRPPGNRTPTPQETEICKPFIQRQIELVNPDVLVFLGAASAKTLLGVQDGIRKMRGRWMQYPCNGKQISAIATYHPAYLLRSPLEKRLSWRDFLSIREKLTSQ
ncbi:uracil-DNA glycosylase family protein [Roseibium sp.]|uniref:uracil-DNA glycosylase family protein n=1 Tax=Roseibium sp. TaxID=1936156 RepID=UPI0039EEE776